MTASAIRSRRYRARKAQRIRCFRLRLRDTVIAALIADGFLPPDWRNDVDVEHAFYALIYAARAAGVTARHP
jgi:hypothetical protein